MKGNDEAVQLAGAILRFRRCRMEVFSPDIFGEPAWEMLLELFVADAHSVPITGRIVADRHRVAASVMSRWLKHLTVQSLLIGDGDSNLDDELTLSGIAMEKVEAVLLKARFLKDEFFEQPGSVR